MNIIFIYHDITVVICVIVVFQNLYFILCHIINMHFYVFVQVQTPDSNNKFNIEELRAFIQSYLPDAQQKEGEVGDLVYALPPYTPQNAAVYHSLLTGLDQNLDKLQLGCYGISDTTLEEVIIRWRPRCRTGLWTRPVPLGFRLPAQRPLKPQAVQPKTAKGSWTILGSLGFLAHIVQASQFASLQNQILSRAGRYLIIEMLLV